MRLLLELSESNLHNVINAVDQGDILWDVKMTRALQSCRSLAHRMWIQLITFCYHCSGKIWTMTSFTVVFGDFFFFFAPYTLNKYSIWNDNSIIIFQAKTHWPVYTSQHYPVREYHMEHIWIAEHIWMNLFFFFFAYVGQMRVIKRVHLSPFFASGRNTISTCFNKQFFNYPEILFFRDKCQCLTQ